MAAVACSGSHCQPFPSNFFITTLCSMKLIMGITAILLPVLCPAQPAVRPLTIGDSVPGIRLGTIINYANPAAKLSSFKGRLVLLDFMNTYCSNCIAALPAFDSLQRKYGDKLQIFMVTNE